MNDPHQLTALHPSHADTQKTWFYDLEPVVANLKAVKMEPPK
jgi:hypothetical protein